MRHLLAIYLTLIYLSIVRVQTTNKYRNDVEDMAKGEANLARYILSENSIGNILRHVMQTSLLVKGGEIKLKRLKESSSKNGHSLMTRLRLVRLDYSFFI